MIKNNLIIFIFILMQPSLMGEEVFYFEPLEPYERLAYRMEGIKGRDLHLYVQNKESSRITRSIGIWEDSSEWGFLQFANDRRDCYFVVYLSGQGLGSEIRRVFKVSGNEGIVICFFDNIIGNNFRVSYNGKFLLLLDGSDEVYYDSMTKCFFHLYDTGSRSLIETFSFSVKKAIGVGFTLRRRNDGMFRLFYVGEGSYVYAEALLDPISLELQVVWDKTDFDYAHNEREILSNFVDDVSIQHKDKTLNLEEVIFEPGQGEDIPTSEPPVSTGGNTPVETVAPAKPEEPSSADQPLVPAGQVETKAERAINPLWLYCGGLFLSLGIIMLVMRWVKRKG